MRGGGQSGQTTITSVHNLPMVNRQGTTPGIVLLYANRPAQFSSAYALTDSGLLLGREPNCDVCVPEHVVSRHHAKIEPQGGGWLIRDLGGKNGTIVNGVRIESAPLKHLDQIHVGTAIFKFVEDEIHGYARYRLGLSDEGEEWVVGGYQFHQILSDVRDIATTQLNVILRGKSGTGKDVVARYIHQQSGRSGSFLAINCSAIAPNLVESELFGHKRGAFSGATNDHLGLIRAARSGTLFLDEIGDLPLDSQAKFLRVIQTKEVIPVGSTTPESVDVRFVCATHRDLDKMVADQVFRGDLLARLDEFRVDLQELRERKEDIYALCQFFIRKSERPNLTWDDSWMTALLHYDFPFQVRELEGFVKRAVALCKESTLRLSHLPDRVSRLMANYGKGPTSIAPNAIQQESSELQLSRFPPKQEDLENALRRHEGNIAAVAREFRKMPTQVHRWLERYGLNVNDYRAKRS